MVKLAHVTAQLWNRGQCELACKIVRAFKPAPLDPQDGTTPVQNPGNDMRPAPDSERTGFFTTLRHQLGNLGFKSIIKRSYTPTTGWPWILREAIPIRAAADNDACLFLTVPSEVATPLKKLVNEFPKPIKDMLHVTVVHLGANQTPESLGSIRNIVQNKLVKQEQLEAQITELDYSESNENGQCSVILKINCPGLQELRGSLCRKLNRADIEFSNDSKYTPHIALGYIDKATTNTLLPKLKRQLNKLPSRIWNVDSLTLAIGNHAKHIKFGERNTGKTETVG